MIFLDFLAKLLKGKRNATRTAKLEDVRQQHDGSGIHRFASAAERTISDCRRVGMLASAVSAQSGRAADCSPRDKIRQLIMAAKTADLYVPPERVRALGDLVSKRTGTTSRSSCPYTSISSSPPRKPSMN